MEEETFTDPSVRGLLQRLVCVRLDVDRQPEEASRYGVNSIPRLLVLPAGGGQPVMDIQGFLEAGPLAQELRRALGLKPEAGGASAGYPRSGSGARREGPVPGAPVENTELTLVRQALQNRRFAALKASNPKAARAGLGQLVAQLGVFQEPQLAPTAALIRGAGDDAIPALIQGMGHRHLAVRAGSYRTLQGLLRDRLGPGSNVRRAKTGRELWLAGAPAFDPWAPAPTRRLQLQRWAHWWKSRRS
jgi:hypothetical protein